ncbi:hypothetical protein [Nonomuraea sp. NPDC052265]|uniref:hypothetical protein n=1 Tax=Nonomuraea sp. NPDC052265 TaxID=3364374 RepID=UPI0037C882D7
MNAGDYAETASRIAKARREKIYGALGGIELAQEERAFVCATAWNGSSEALVSLIEKVRRDADAERVAALVSATGFEFAPASKDGKAWVLATIRRAHRKIEQGGWPGMPIGWLPVREAPSMHELIDEGRIEMVAVTKQSKVTPGKRMQYSYVRITKEGDVSQ